jgi:OOP family OmpA-OmpF porin
MRRAFVLIVLLSGVARADDAFSLQLFRPAVDSKGYFAVDASATLGHLDFSLGQVGSYAREVLVLQRDDASYRVSDLITTQIQMALGLWRWLEIGLSLPVHLLFGSRTPGYVSPNGGNHNSDLAFGAQFLGDAGIHPKVRILNTSRHPVGLAIVTSVYLPTGQSQSFLGEGKVSLRPEIIVDKEWRRFRLALNLGALVRMSKNTFTDRGAMVTDPTPVCFPTTSAGCGTGESRSLGTQLVYALALSGAVVPQRVELLGELYGYADVTGSAHGYPLEWLAGAKVYLASRSYFEIGFGTRIIPDQTGSPSLRAFLGFVFEPSIGDRDGDGLKDDIDKCPDDPEDHDDFEDEDGCPDPDNDRDGILDADDKCPNEPETKNQFEDEDGCPDTTLLDRDGDRIPDAVDKCPDDPEDYDRFEDQDGCPDPDNDRDEIPDVDDLCPNDPEDRDHFEDEDGCPDPDNDKDRILDVDDKCPNEPEIYNGFRDDDGCPDKYIVRRKGSTLEILEKIHFETAKAIIKPISYRILDAIAATLKGNPEIALLEIQGHADERGDDDYNRRLTEDRAQAVRQYLVDHGIAPARLLAHGYGEDRAICRARSRSCLATNRRVEFVILRQDGVIPGAN